MGLVFHQLLEYELGIRPSHIDIEVVELESEDTMSQLE